jgi:diguanylate cyclase (GGDEF)-like protein
MSSLETSIPEITDHQAFRGTIADLDRNVTRGFVSAAGGMVALLAVPVALFLVRHRFPGNDFAATLVVGGLIVLSLACSAHGLIQYHGLKQIRNKLNEQLHVSIKQRKRAEKLYGLSILDPLTGLHNRRFGEERLAEEINRAENTGDPLAIIILDLDHFKEINDEFGHDAGDAALKEFSRKLRKAIRSCDVPVRMGGDEFLVILPECPRDKANVILSRLGTPEVAINSQKLAIRYSVGRAQHQVTDSIKSMLKRADEGLYAQKRARSNKSANPRTIAGFNASKSPLEDLEPCRTQPGLEIVN